MIQLQTGITSMPPIKHDAIPNSIHNINQNLLYISLLFCSINAAIFELKAVKSASDL
ncbi:hypothetical protein ABIB30_000575 [Pedobacter sp. UYP1]